MRTRFAILSKDELRELENSIMQLENLAKRKEAASAKLREKRKGGKISVFGGLESDEPTLPSSLLRRKRETLTSRKADSDVFNSAKKFKDTTSKQPVKDPQKIVDRIEKIEQTLDKSQKDLQKLSQLISDPAGFFVGMLGNSTVLKALSAGGAAFGLAKIIFDLVRSYYGPNGAGDIRKQVLDQASLLPELSYLNSVRTGQVFFTSETRVRSMLVQNSVSQNLGERHRLYNELNIGSDILG
ncbi:MAG: hypothetical protein QXW37_08465 [Candidatus Nitrosotenuis sp.]